MSQYHQRAVTSPHASMVSPAGARPSLTPHLPQSLGGPVSDPLPRLSPPTLQRSSRSRSPPARARNVVNAALTPSSLARFPSSSPTRDVTSRPDRSPSMPRRTLSPPVLPPPGDVDTEFERTARLVADSKLTAVSAGGDDRVPPSTEVILAQKNIELYTMIAERDDELRRLRSDNSRLKSELTALRANVDAVVNGRVQNETDTAVGEMRLANHQALEEVEAERAQVERLLRDEVARVEELKQEATATLARAELLASQHGSPDRSAAPLPRTIVAPRVAEATLRGNNSASSARQARPTKGTSPSVLRLALAVAVLVLCIIAIAVCGAVVVMRVLRSPADDDRTEL